MSIRPREILAILVLLPALALPLLWSALCLGRIAAGRATRALAAAVHRRRRRPGRPIP